MASYKKLISSIIDELSDTDSSLSKPLVKTKILASRINNQKLLNWADEEIQGYDIKNVPDYRMGKTRIVCTIYKFGSMFQNEPLPIMVLSEQWRNLLQRTLFDEGVQSIEYVASGALGDTIIRFFGADFDAIINHDIQSVAHHDFTVEDIRTETNITQAKNALSKIRNKLLDLMLELETSIKDTQDEEAEKEAANQVINHFMTNVNITSSGTGNTINTGHNNTITVTNIIKKGDLSSLKEVLRSQHVAESDIEEIAQIVPLEPYNEAAKTFGAMTQAWMGKMMTKSIDGSWQVGIGAAGTLLAEALKAYFGA